MSDADLRALLAAEPKPRGTPVAANQKTLPGRQVKVAAIPIGNRPYGVVAGHVLEELDHLLAHVDSSVHASIP